MVTAWHANWYFCISYYNDEEILPSGEIPKIINLNFRQWERNDYSM